MAGTSGGLFVVGLASTSNDIFDGTLQGDVLLYATRSNQTIHIGPESLQSKESTIAIRKNSARFMGPMTLNSDSNMLDDASRSMPYWRVESDGTLASSAYIPSISMGRLVRSQESWPSFEFSTRVFGDRRMLYVSNSTSFGIRNMNDLEHVIPSNYAWYKGESVTDPMMRMTDRGLFLTSGLDVGRALPESVVTAVSVASSNYETTVAFLAGATTNRTALSVQGPSNLVLGAALNLDPSGRLGATSNLPNVAIYATSNTEIGLLLETASFSERSGSNAFSAGLSGSNLRIGHASNSNAWTADPRGYVGVGTSAPSARLHAYDKRGITLQTSDALSELTLVTPAVGPSNCAIRCSPSNLVLYSAIALNSNGNVGIGTGPSLSNALDSFGNTYVSSDLYMDYQDPTTYPPFFIAHGIIGTENLYTWFADDTIVNSASSNTAPKEPFWKVYTGLSNTSFERLRSFGTAGFAADYYTTLFQLQYMIRMTNQQLESPGGSALIPSNYNSISVPIEPGFSHAFFFKIIAYDRWSSTAAYATNKNRTSFTRLPTRTNSYSATVPYTSWIDPLGSPSPSHLYHEWLMFSVPKYVVDAYAYTESNDNKSRYATNIDICVTRGFGNTSDIYCSGIASRTNPYGLVFHGAFETHVAANGGTRTSFNSSNYIGENRNQFDANSNYNNIRVPICPPSSNAPFPDFYLGLVANYHMAEEYHVHVYLQNPGDSNDVQYLGQFSRGTKGRYGQSLTETYRNGVGLIVPSPDPKYVVFVGGYPYLNIRYDNNAFGAGIASFSRGFYTEVVDPRGLPVGFQSYSANPIAWWP